MTNTVRRAILPGDLVIYLLVGAAAVCSALLLSAPRDKAVYAEVTSGGVTTRYPLDADTSVTLTGEGYTLTLEIADGSARIAQSDCPDRVCVNTGYVSRPGQSIICVPARISVRLTGGRSSADAIAG
jgi:hypothetical protein